MSVQFQTIISIIHGADSYTFPAFETCSVSSSATSATSNTVPSFTFEVRTKDKSLVDRFPPISSEVTIWQGKIGNLKKTMCGFLKKINKTKDSSLIVLQYEGVGYYEKSQHIIVNESYTGKTFDYIVRDLHNKYIPQFPIGVIEYCGIVVPPIKFSMQFLYNVFEKLAQMVTFTPYINNDKTFNFHSDNYLVNNNTITEAASYFETGSANFQDNTDKLVNQLYVMGGYKIAADIVTQKWTCNGVDQTFTFSNKPMTSLSDNTVPFTHNGTAVGYGWTGIDQFGTIDPRGNSIKILIDPNGINFQTDVAYPSGDTFQTQYRYQYPIVDILNDVASQAIYGIITDTITIKSNDTDFVMQQAQNHLDLYSIPITTGSINPFEPLYNAGEAVLINIPTLNINKYFKIMSLNYDSTPTWVNCCLNLEEVR